MSDSVSRDSLPQRGERSSTETPRTNTIGPMALWDHNPIHTFERFRDCVCIAIERVSMFHQEAKRSERNETLSQLAVKLTNDAGTFQDRLDQVIEEAQLIWEGTPVRVFLTRSDAPVYLQSLDAQPAGEVLGCCYHDFSLGVACFFRNCIEESLSIRDFLAVVRVRTAAGDDVTQRLFSLKSLVECESQSAVQKYRFEESSQLSFDLRLVFRDAANLALSAWRNLPDVMPGVDPFDHVPIRKTDALYSQLSVSLSRPKYNETTWREALGRSAYSSKIRVALNRLYEAVDCESDRSSMQRNSGSLRTAFKKLNEGLALLYGELPRSDHAGLE